MTRDELGVLYVKHRHTLLRTAARRLGSQEDAEDVVNDTFTYVLDNLSMYDHEKSKPLTWLANGVNRRVVDALRRKKAALSRDGLYAHLSSQSSHALDPDRQREAEEYEVQKSVVLERLDELLTKDTTIPHGVARAIQAHYVEGTDLETVSREVGMSRRTLTRRMQEVMQSLKEGFERDELP